MDFSLPGPPCGVADAEFEEGGVLVNQQVNESALNIRALTLPTPEQPEITKGLCLMISFW